MYRFIDTLREFYFDYLAEMEWEMVPFLGKNEVSDILQKQLIYSTLGA